VLAAYLLAPVLVFSRLQTFSPHKPPLVSSGASCQAKVHSIPVTTSLVSAWALVDSWDPVVAMASPGLYLTALRRGQFHPGSFRP